MAKKKKKTSQVNTEPEVIKEAVVQEEPAVTEEPVPAEEPAAAEEPAEPAPVEEPAPAEEPKPAEEPLKGRGKKKWAWGEKRKREWYVQYNISDDNRIYYYDNARKFKFSPQLIEWLNEVSKRYQNILKKTKRIPQYTDHLKQLVDVCVSCESNGQGLYFFNDAFYEFIYPLTQHLKFA